MPAWVSARRQRVSAISEKLISKILRLALYVVVGIIVAVLMAFGAWYNASSGMNLHFPLQWVQLALWTAVTFGFVAKQLGQYWGVALFWVAVLALSAIHLLAYIVVLQRCPEFRPVWFMFITIVECVLLTMILDVLFSHKTR